MCPESVQFPAAIATREGQVPTTQKRRRANAGIKTESWCTSAQMYVCYRMLRTSQRGQWLIAIGVMCHDGDEPILEYEYIYMYILCTYVITEDYWVNCTSAWAHDDAVPAKVNASLPCKPYRTVCQLYATWQDRNTICYGHRYLSE